MSPRIRLLLSLALLLFCKFGVASTTSLNATTQGGPSVPGDRWMEIDLYWFDRANLVASADEFWQRFAPLYANVEGDKGVVLNIGWTVNYIMEFSGDLNQHLVLPKGYGQQPWVAETGPLPGSTADRQREWKERFSQARIVQRTGYGDWTYADIRQLGKLLRQGASHRGIYKFKIGSLCYAWTNAYGEKAPFYKTHPEAWTKWTYTPTDNFDFDNDFDPVATLHADPQKRAGLPSGIAEGMPVHTAFAAQWGALSHAIGLDAIMLRDSFGFPTPYTRAGPKGPLMPSAEAIHRATAGVSALLRETKQANPDSLTMMYSNGASAISDWRSNGCDLESVAREGNLDIFVDQTWAGAWNEVGIRNDIFWNFPLLGWTHQLAYMLEHAAMLSDTKVRHYPLVETFDAWESWDTLHTVPQRLRWGIWAYSHGGVKTPTGIRVPEGSYISWANQGKRLLSVSDVQFLSTNMNAAVRDAAQTKEIYGPTLVYSRDAMQYQAEHASPDHSIKEWTDEQVAVAIKWPLPVLSITRAEWVPAVESDLFVFGAPSNLPSTQLKAIEEQARRGQPMSFVGSTLDGIDPSLLRLAGWSTTANTSQPPRSVKGHLGELRLKEALHVPDSFPVLQSVTSASAASDTVVYTVDAEPGLVLRSAENLNVSVWDPPNLLLACCKPLHESLGGSAAAYTLYAATLTGQLARKDLLRAAVVDFEQTGTVGAWRTSDGHFHLLAGNMEEGLRDDADHSRHIAMQLPPIWKPLHWISAWSNEKYTTQGGELQLNLAPESSVLIDSLEGGESMGANKH